MAGKSDFSVEEWDLLRQAPLMSSMVIVASDPSGPIGLMKESVAASKVMMESAQNAQTPLLRELTQDLTRTMSVPRRPEGAGTCAIMESALNTLRQTSELLDRKASPEEADEIKQWLGTIAQKTAEAAKEGGFLGIGGALVSDKEKEALASIGSALGKRAA